MKQFITWDQYQTNLDLLIHEIDQSKVEFKYIYAVPRGGLIPGVVLSHEFNVPIITSEEIMLTKPLIDILIVDDIVDSGKTLFKYFQRSYKIASVYVRKPTANFIPTFYGEMISHDDWLVFPYESNDTKDTISIVKENK